jgi:hypothetical protein
MPLLTANRFENCIELGDVIYFRMRCMSSISFLTCCSGMFSQRERREEHCGYDAAIAPSRQTQERGCEDRFKQDHAIGLAF